MFRKIVCILSVVGMLLVFGIPVQAVVDLEKGLHPAAICSEPPNTGDYPAPIFTAMLISMGIVVVLVMTENRKK